jgi:nickel-dependent lactate racemase
MDVELQFGGDRVVLKIPDDRVGLSWSPPAGSLASGSLREAVLHALENPRDFPPLRQAVVPGDRVALAVGPGIPDVSAVLQAVCETLQDAGVDAESITIVTRSKDDAPTNPVGTKHVVHDPTETSELAYLSSTAAGRRIYLNRHLTDADFVVPFSLIAIDPAQGIRGPWSALYPNLSDQPPPAATPEDAMAESVEVGWLLGTPFHLGIVDGGDVIAGSDVAVREQGISAVTEAWTVRIADRPDVIVGGVGSETATWSELGRALANATEAVQRGGKIILLSHLAEPVGPAVRLLGNLDDPREATAALKGAEHEPDYQAARSLAKALEWADVYLSSDLPDDLIEDLGMIPLSRPGDAQRLLATAYSCAMISRIEAVRMHLSPVDAESR